MPRELGFGAPQGGSGHLGLPAAEGKGGRRPRDSKWVPLGLGRRVRNQGGVEKAGAQNQCTFTPWAWR